jgi:hypothetical protein
MTLPVFFNWEQTRTGLHQATQVIGALRAAAAEPEPNHVHLGLRVVPQGLTTGTLPSIGEFMLDFTTLAILYDPPDHEPVGFSLARHSQMSLADAVLQALAGFGHTLTLNRKKITGETIFQIDSYTAADYAELLVLLSKMLEHFRDSLPGKKTPVVVWPHGFDISFLWFVTDVASEDAPHMAFGFSPYSEGLEQSYVYAYAHPIPGGLTELTLPSPAHWHTGKWTGAAIDYDNLIGVKTPETVIEDSLRAIYQIVSPLLRGLSGG